jgi:hypothetical protein
MPAKLKYNRQFKRAAGTPKHTSTGKSMTHFR